MSPGLSPAALRPGMSLVGRWALSPRIGWVAMRRRVDAAGRFPGPPRGTAITPRLIGSVACEELRPPGGTDDARLLYLHGGGYVVGSPRSHRSLIGRMAVGFGAPALAVDYRLAPEHPHPAALEDVLAVWDALTGAGLAADRDRGGRRFGGRRTCARARPQPARRRAAVAGGDRPDLAVAGPRRRHRRGSRSRPARRAAQPRAAARLRRRLPERRRLPPRSARLAPVRGPGRLAPARRAHHRRRGDPRRRSRARRSRPRRRGRRSSARSSPTSGTTPT